MLKPIYQQNKMWFPGQSFFSKGTPPYRRNLLLFLPIREINTSKSVISLVSIYNIWGYDQTEEVQTGLCLCYVHTLLVHMYSSYFIY